MQRLRVLILGGAGEAAGLAESLAGDRRFDATLSLAGATQAPRPAPIASRSGGFGGAEGLARYLGDQNIQALIVATHPFAAQIRLNALQAVRRAPVPLLLIERPAWSPVEGDRWIRVADMAAAAAALGPVQQRVLLTIGRKELAAFAAAPGHHYVVRSVDPAPPDLLPPGAEVILERGPFDEANERRLLQEQRIDVLVTKNSGGAATEAKLRAARALGLPVIMVDRPPPADLDDVAADVAQDAAAAKLWLELLHQTLSTAKRGV
jgi:precorrin-6A/cobalt-precorrin-6A reductase